MARSYYTLVTRDWDSETHEMGPWAPQFGDYSRKVVTDERDEYANEYSRDDMKIVKSGDTQAEINAAVAELNNWRK